MPSSLPLGSRPAPVPHLVSSFASPCHLPQDLEGDEGGELAPTKSRYVVAQLPVRLPALRPLAGQPNPKLGVGEWQGGRRRARAAA